MSRINITEIKEKIKRLLNEADREGLVTVFIIIISSTAAFGLGRLSALENSREPITLAGFPDSAVSSTNMAAAAASSAAGRQENPGLYVASKTGKKYYFPWCSGANLIKDDNKVWFNSKEEALKAGYSPAANCKGMN